MAQFNRDFILVHAPEVHSTHALYAFQTTLDMPFQELIGVRNRHIDRNPHPHDPPATGIELKHSYPIARILRQFRSETLEAIDDLIVGQDHFRVVPELNRSTHSIGRAVRANSLYALYCAQLFFQWPGDLSFGFLGRGVAVIVFNIHVQESRCKPRREQFHRQVKIGDNTQQQ